MSEHGILSPKTRHWLGEVLATNETNLTLHPLAGDASFRRYHRLTTPERQAILMTDPSQEQQQRFLNIRAALEKSGIRVPALFAQTDGALLLEDLGDTPLLGALTPANADTLYPKAFETLIRLQRAAIDLPPYDPRRLNQETALYIDWYCAGHHRRPLTAAAKKTFHRHSQTLSEKMQTPPLLPVHRDYHSRNLMLLTDGDIGVIDFQDAVIGSPGYDPVSLLRDAYIVWDNDRQHRWLHQYWQEARTANLLPLSFEDYWRRFNLAGLQRGLKVLGIFSRLAQRDHKPGYLGDLPAVHQQLLLARPALPEYSALFDCIVDYPPCAH